ncbi:hypothetical protein TCAL_06604 [Tigriopus californicus]|uniref:PHD-type domain-containing protein n=1 Tax=Tigriopus californicus TaxID=6832 RepID=A0A553PNT0_TIGCA|nr:protein AF-10-like [Tigriopus californicus]TRY79337.1 hypothetical protein TCAL_06604 [Tigriopus californicus]
MPKIEKRPSLGLAGTGGVSSSSSSTLEAPTDHGLTAPASDAATPPGPPSPPVSSLGPTWPAMGGPLRSGGRILGGGMISSDEEDENREMVGGCCVCSDERGWDENPLVYCDGLGCNVAVHQACYGIVSVPTGPWFCRKCESQERSARVRCELCPSREGALKRTDTNSWAHVVCALYIPEVRFGNVSTMEPIVLGLIPQDRFLKVCYLCEKQGRESKAATGACMQCNRAGCKQSFHVTCAQSAGFLCEEAGNYMDNVKYCGYCEYHYQRINKKIVKTIPAFKPVKNPVREGQSPDSSPEKAFKDLKASSSLSTTGLLPPTSSAAGSSNTSSSSTTTASAMSSSVATAAYRKGKKGRKSSSEVKIEAAKFVIDSSSSSSNHEDSSKEALHSNHHHHHHQQQQPNHHHHHHPHHHYSSSSHRPGGDPNGRSGTMMGPSRSKGEAKETSTLTSTSGGPARSEDSRPSSRESPQEKQPVILKFGKQDNGQYYKKDVSSSSSSSSSSKKDKDRDKYRSSKDKRSHHREDRAHEADSSGRVTPTSNSNSNPHKPMDKSDKSSARKGETSTATTSTTSTTTTTTTTSSSSSETAAVKVEAMEVDSADAALSAIKTTSCSVSLDKSKVDMKLLAASSGVNGGLTSTAPTTTTKSEVQITPISVASTTKVEADTSSSKKDANSSVIETIKQRGSDVYAMMPDDEDVKPEPLSLLTSKVNSDTDSGVTMTSVQATAMPSSGSGSNNANPLESGPAKAMDASTSSGAVSSSAGQSGPSNGGRVTIEQVAINKKDDTSPPLGKLPRMSASGKRIGRPPKKGMHVATNPMSQLTSSSGSTPISQRTGSPDGEGNVKKKRKSPHKKPVNGTDSPSWMLGATLNMNSPMSKEMNLALLDEMKVHSMYDSSKDKHYVGVPLLGKKASSTTSSGSSQTHNASDMLNAGKSQPQTLEELLERQWEQGSQFLMEQASHFDIASLLSSLHQLKEENVDLEDSVDKLVQRRDHLLAVRARLLALSSLSNTNNSAPPTPEKVAPPRAGPHQNGPSTHANRSEGSTPHVSPRNHASSATVSPVSIQRAPANMGGAMTAHPASLPPPSSPRLSQQHLPPPPPSASPREHQRSSVPPQQLPSPRDSRISPRGTPMENGLDYHSAQPQHHMAPSHYSHRGAPPGRIDVPPSGPPTSHAMNDRMPPMSQAHLLAVATTASRMSSHPAPPPRQSTYPPPGVGQQHNSRSMPTHGMAPHPSMMRGPSQHPPMPSHYGPPPGSHGGSQPGAPSGYQMISPPPSHGGPPPGSMVTLDRTSQQPMRNPPPSHHGSTMRMDKR